MEVMAGTATDSVSFVPLFFVLFAFVFHMSRKLANLRVHIGLYVVQPRKLRCTDRLNHHIAWPQHASAWLVSTREHDIHGSFRCIEPWPPVHIAIVVSVSTTSEHAYGRLTEGVGVRVSAPSCPASRVLCSLNSKPQVILYGPANALLWPLIWQKRVEVWQAVVRRTPRQLDDDGFGPDLQEYM